MGGDLGPAEMVKAVALGLQHYPEIAPIIIVGDESQLKGLIREAGLEGEERVRILHAGEVINMEEKPLSAIRQKKDSSLVRAIEAVRDGEALGVISTGNTGALMAAATLRLRMIPGFERPALGTVIPQREQPFLLIDSGANPDPKPEHLVHNGLLGARYMESALGRKHPRVSLLSIGLEEGKGTEAVNAAHELFTKCGAHLNYIGRMEGFQMFENHADVVVTDGFTGNVTLKTMESLWGMAKGFVLDEIKVSLWRKLGAYMARGAFRSVKSKLDPTPFGGAPLMGVNGLVVKSHGSSNRHYLMHAMRLARISLKEDLRQRLADDVDNVNSLLKAADISQTEPENSESPV